MKTQTLPQSDGCKSGFQPGRQGTVTFAGDFSRKMWQGIADRLRGYRRGQPCRGRSRQHRQEGAERASSLQDWSQQATAQWVELEFPRRAACVWAGGAREGCPWEVPHCGRAGSRPACAGKGALGVGPWGLGGSCPQWGAFSEHRPGLPPVSRWRPLQDA